MATVDKLIVRIEADMKDLKSKLKSAETATKASTGKMKASFAQLKTSVGGVGRSIFSLKGALVGLGVGAGLKSLINVGTQVESLQIRFETLFGSAEEGSKAFETMANFASKVPFSLAAIQQGSGSLIAVAKDAEELGELLEITGTIAAATGLDFNTASQQIQRSLSAGIGAADLFRDRGVTAMLGFKAGAQVTVAETREAFVKFAEDNKGITDRLAGTFAGTLSMIGDSVFNFQRTINDAGFFSELTAHFTELKDTMDDNKLAITEFANDLSGVLVDAMKALTEAIKFVAKNMDLIILAFKAFVFLKIAKMIGGIIIAFKLMAGAITGATVAQRKLNLAMKANILGALITLTLLFSDTIIKAFKSVGKFISGIFSAEEAEKELAESLKKTNEVLLSGFGGFEGMGAAVADAKERTKGLDATVQDYIKTLEQEIALIGVSNRQKEITKALLKQEVEATSKAGIAITNAINAKHDAIEADKNYQLSIAANKTLTDEQVAAEEKARDITDAMTDANILLKAELEGLNEVGLEKLKIQLANKDASQEEIALIMVQIEKNAELKRSIENLNVARKQKEDAQLARAAKNAGEGGGMFDEPTEKDAEVTALDEVMAKRDAKIKETLMDLKLLSKAEEEYAESLMFLDLALQNGVINQDEYSMGLGRLKVALFESTEEGKIAMEGLERVTEFLADSTADALSGMSEGWKGFRDGLKSIVRDIIAQLLKLQAQQAITKLMGGGGGSGGGGFDFGKILSFGSSFFGGGGGGSVGPSSMGSVGYGRANGGTVTANQPYMVGEKGPEMFVPNTSGGVFTNRSLKNSGGGGATVNQTINIETGVAQTVRAELQSLMPQIKMETVSAVIDAKKRGGQMADTFS